MKKYSLHFDGALELIKCVKEIEKAHLAHREEIQKMRRITTLYTAHLRRMYF